MGNCNAIIVEFWRVLEGLKLTKRLGLTRVKVNVDSELAVRAIWRESSSNPSCLALIREIKKLIKEYDIVIISHIFKEVNNFADVLAKMGYMDKEVRFLSTFLML